MALRFAVVLITTLSLTAGLVEAQMDTDRAAIDRAVISKLRTQYGINSKVIRHVDLTEPFKTKSQWSLVAAKQPDEQSSVTDGAGNQIGAVHFCFVQNGQPDCKEEVFLAKYREEKYTLHAGEAAFYEFFGSDVAFSGPGSTRPLLRVRACTYSGANGNCGVSLFLFDYDQESDRFHTVFFNLMGRNNNQEARFIESGPLLGAVIVASPTSDAPFTYFVEVYKRGANGKYSRILEYRGHTGYGDGNPLAVIDSEMPETLRHLGLWQAGDPLPVPPRMPRGCTKLVMRGGVEWCEPR